MPKLPLLPLLLFSLALPAQESIFDRLSEQAADQLPVSLKLGEVDTDSDDQRRSAIFQFRAGDVDVFLKASVTERGRFRRHTCTHKPLKVNFKKKSLVAEGFSEYDKYKLVLPCHPGKDHEAAVLREYLAYRAYQQFTMYSFRVRLLALSIEGSEGHHTMPAFLIENKHELAARLQLREVDKLYGNMLDDFAPEPEATHALFQYFIANGDWNVHLARNTKLFRTAEGKIVPVGYDFDFSGWVSAPYARPTSAHGQTTLQDRVYLGYAQSNRLLWSISDDFLRQRAAVTELVQDHPTLRKYVNRTFRELERGLRKDIGGYYQELRGNHEDVIPIAGDPEDFTAM